MVRFAVAVVGAGPAGCAAASAAATSVGSPEVVLLDSDLAADGARTWRVGEGAAPGTPRLVDEIFGAGTAAFVPGRHLPSPGTVSLWGMPDPLVTDHLLNPLGCAWNLDRRAFDDDLRAGIGRLGIERRSAKVVAAERQRTGWNVQIQHPSGRRSSLQACALVDATGRGARLARQQGAKQQHHDRLVSLWSLWEVGETDQTASTYVEATEGGWWYSVLLPEGRRVVAHLTDVDLLPTDAGARCDLINSARQLPLIGTLLSQTSAALSGPPRVIVARSSRLDSPVGAGWIAAGDAASTVDPLSGRGIVAALLMGRGAGAAAAALVAGHATSDYQQLVNDLCQDSLLRQAQAYGDERRWPDAPFWQRRHARSHIRPTGPETSPHPGRAGQNLAATNFLAAISRQ